MPDTISVNVLIGDRNYRLKVSPEDEEQLRNTVKTINNKLLEFKAHFAGKDMQDYVAMVLLWLATENRNELKDPRHLQEAAEKVRSLKVMIEKSLDGGDE